MAFTGRLFVVQEPFVIVVATKSSFPALSLWIITTLFSLAKLFVSLAVPLSVNNVFCLSLKVGNSTVGDEKSTSNSTVFQSDLFPALSSDLMCRYFLPSSACVKSYVKFQEPVDGKIVPLSGDVAFSLIKYSTCFTPVAESPVSCVFPWNL